MVNRFANRTWLMSCLCNKGPILGPFSFPCDSYTVFFCFFRQIYFKFEAPVTCEKTKQMELSAKEIKDMVSFYQDEKLRLNAKLKHVDALLRKLQGNNVDSESGVLLTRTGTKAKKRGPKSVWGKFILEQLDVAQRPMTYKELMDIAMDTHGYDKSKYANVRASILNSAFRLRAIAGKVTTIGELGKKEKFIVSTKWLDEKGRLPKAHVNWLKETMDFHPEKVDMGTIPRAKYEEDLAS